MNIAKARKIRKTLSFEFIYGKINIEEYQGYHNNFAIFCPLLTKIERHTAQNFMSFIKHQR